MMKKGNDKKNKKNRSFESNLDPLSPGDKKLGNSPKRSKKENKINNLANVLTNEKSSNKIEIVSSEEVTSQVTVENSPLPEGANRKANNRLDFINAKKK